MATSLPTDRLGDPLDAVELVALDGFGLRSTRPPHRHDYHELVWTRSGAGRHELDGTPLEAGAGTLALIPRGQVHVFARAEAVDGWVVRFGDALVPPRTRWLLSGAGGRVVGVPPGERAGLEALLAALHAELERPPDARTGTLLAHGVASLLLWTERWHEAARTERREAADLDDALHRRFLEVLDRDWAAHHDAAHYAAALGVPTATLSRALTAATGRGTKGLVSERVMVEAARLLRFTDLSVGEVAHAVGHRDPLYFSRAFKRHAGLAPGPYRERFAGP